MKASRRVFVAYVETELQDVGDGQQDVGACAPGNPQKGANEIEIVQLGVSSVVVAGEAHALLQVQLVDDVLDLVGGHGPGDVCTPSGVLVRSRCLEREVNLEVCSTP